MLQKWLVLIYAAGNNELEPAIFRTFQQLVRLKISEGVQVLVQLARAPNISATNGWSGVRRYLLEQQTLSLVADMGVVNMADPRTLVDFLIWGSTNYPAERIIVVMSGHSAGFLGTMTDYDWVNNNLSIMSIKALSGVLADFYRQTGRKIEILVLDTCFMNMIEVWYELAMVGGQPIVYLVTPLENAPWEGINYQRIFRRLPASECDVAEMQEILKKYIAEINRHSRVDAAIMAVNLDRRALDELKLELSALAEVLIQTPKLLAVFDGAQFEDYSLVSLHDMTRRLIDAVPWMERHCSHIQEILTRIVVAPTLAAVHYGGNLGPSIFLPQTPEQYRDFQGYYDCLLFVQDNQWRTLLRKRAKI